MNIYPPCIIWSTPRGVANVKMITWELFIFICVKLSPRCRKYMLISPEALSGEGDKFQRISSLIFLPGINCFFEPSSRKKWTRPCVVEVFREALINRPHPARLNFNWQPINKFELNVYFIDISKKEASISKTLPPPLLFTTNNSVFYYSDLLCKMNSLYEMKNQSLVKLIIRVKYFGPWD